MIKPVPLKKGDTIGVIAPSSRTRGDREETLGKVERALRAFGLDPEFLPGCRESYGNLSGTDAIRAADINRVFADSRYKGIICLRGGYGTPRLLDLIDYDNIRKNPKVFLGYSDITGLHTAISRHAGLITFHGPMGVSDFFMDNLNSDGYSRSFLEKCLFETGPLGVLENPPSCPIRILNSGVGEGRLAGGNLSLLAATLGSDYEIDARDKILYIEDIDEEPYRIDRMLNALRLAGKFEDCSGVALGTWTNCLAVNPDYSLTLDQIFQDIILPSGKPVLADLQFGHVSSQMTLPNGALARIDGNRGILEILESHNQGE